MRTRAEDYVHKPISFGDLVARARAFVSLPESAGLTDPPPSDDIVIDDEIVLDDAEPLPESNAPAQSVDGDVSSFADQAFDALVKEEAPTKAKAAEPPPPPAPAEPEPERIPSAPPRAPSIPPRASVDGAMQAELDKQRSRSNELESELRSAKDKIAELEDSAGREATKDAEFQKVKRELDETKAKLASAGRGGGSSARAATAGWRTSAGCRWCSSIWC